MASLDLTKDTIDGLQGRRFIFPIAPVSIAASAPSIPPAVKTVDQTVESLAALIPKPLIVIRVDGKIVHDNVTIVVKCPKGHIHKAYLNTLEKEQTFACITCSIKSPYMILLRDVLNDMYNLPFTINEAQDSFSVPIYKLAIKSGCSENLIKDTPRGVTIELKRTKSAPKLHQLLDKFLTPLIERFPLLRHSKHIWKPTVPPITKEMSQLRTVPGDIVSSDSLCIEDCLHYGNKSIAAGKK